jgi:hypothetical protein
MVIRTTIAKVTTGTDTRRTTEITIYVLHLCT